MDWATICMRLRQDANDQTAWDALVARVRALAYRKMSGRPTDLIEDAVADVCAGVVLDIESARSPQTFKGFVLGKYLNVSKGVLRRVGEGGVPLDDAHELADLGAPESGDDPRFIVLDRCLEGLPPRDRQAVELRYFSEAKAEQIAQALRVSEVNARRIVFNGVNRLRKCAQAAVGPQHSGRAG